MERVAVGSATGLQCGRALYQRRSRRPSRAGRGGQSLNNQTVTIKERLLAAAAGALLALAPATLPGADRDPAKELRQVRERIEELQRSVRRDTDRRDALTAQLRDAEENVRGSRARLRELRRRLADSDARLEALTEEREREERDLAQQRTALASQLRAAYMGGREEQLKLLLSQEDPAAAGRMMMYYAYLGRARAARIREIQSLVAKLAEALAAENAERERLASLEADSRRELAAVDAARAERTRTLRAVNAQIRSQGDAIAKLKREAAALEKLLADLRRALADLPPAAGQAFEKVRGRLAWPVPGKIAARFGQPRGGGLRWNGVMIEAGRGTEIRALYEGRVAYADWLPGMGLLLIIDHGGYMSLYAHNDQLFKSVGDRVEGGEVVATVGDSGGRSQPGLYLEIRQGAKPVDPVPWFRRPAP